MTARNRTAVVALTVVALVALVYVLRLVLSNDALLLEHVSERRTELTEIALWAGADPSYRDDDGRSALPVAVELGDSVLVRVLLEAGADPNALTPYGEPVGAVAAGGGETGILAMLLDAGADPNATGESGIAVLASAVLHGDAEMVHMLLEAGADPNTLAEEDLSVLALAVDRGDLAVAQLLLDAGADPNGPGIADLVQRSGNADVLELLEAGVVTAEALLALAELGLNALGSLDEIIGGVICIFTLGVGC
ncbi:MAG: ankyrin repeat domain-containing protein [Chloroflexota bacterium]|nr:ankyrin repeat domain-containing protein [Chloroflexota bacterium]